VLPWLRWWTAAIPLTGEERAEQSGCEQSRQKLYWSMSGCEQSGWQMTQDLVLTQM